MPSSPHDFLVCAGHVDGRLHSAVMWRKYERALCPVCQQRGEPGMLPGSFCQQDVEDRVDYEEVE